LAEESEVASVAQAILQYLSQHPHARDTVEGIRQFWFLQAQGPPSKPVVLEALQELMGRGLVIESSSRAAESLYGANKERLKLRGED
jgi:hypothetical protein